MGDLMLAVMTEIPTTRQWRSDQVSALRGGGASAVQVRTHDLIRDRVETSHLQPSTALDFSHGFRLLRPLFLPEGKALLGGI